MSGMFKQETNKNQEVGVDQLPARVLKEVSDLERTLGLVVATAFKGMGLSSKDMGAEQKVVGFNA